MSENEKKNVTIPSIAAFIGGLLIAFVGAIIGFCIVASLDVKWTGPTEVSGHPLTQLFENVNDL